MLAGGVAMLAGWKPKPAGRSARPGSFRSAYLLGVFSGVASACCAPVLAGVAVLSGAAASVPAALGIGLAYVAGMVAPLCLIALLWDRHQDRLAPLLTGRDVRLRLGSWQRRLPLGNALSGLLLIAMGALAGVLAFTSTARRQASRAPAPCGGCVEIGRASPSASCAGRSIDGWTPSRVENIPMCNGIWAGMGLWALLPILILVAMLVLAALGGVGLFRQLRGGADRDIPASAETAKELLRRRYAAGEIEDEEYERRLTALTSWR